MISLRRRFIQIFLSLTIFKHVITREILPENCHCRDWYGACRLFGETWTDDEIWVYRCNARDSAAAELIACEVKIDGQYRQIPAGSNQTINKYWYSCELDEIKQKYSKEPRCKVNGTDRHVGEIYREETFEWICLESGRWVTGCYYQNETLDWVRLKIGEVGYNGLIRHTCDRYKDNPGLIQYHAEIRNDIPYKNPSNKGLNKNFPKLIDQRLKQEPTPWTHQNVFAFIENENDPNTKVRYLPQSRYIQQPNHIFN